MRRQTRTALRAPGVNSGSKERRLRGSGVWIALSCVLGTPMLMSHRSRFGVKHAHLCLFHHVVHDSLQIPGLFKYFELTVRPIAHLKDTMNIVDLFTAI